MLGLRGCRLGITYPEITEMQARAIFEAAVIVKRGGIHPHLEIMVPLTAGIGEMRHQAAIRQPSGSHQAAIIRRVAIEIFTREGETVEYLVGTMIELARAALLANEVALEAEFFSFGTNDLTQTVYGISRDDGNQFVPEYIHQGIFQQDPFAVLDQAGVGQLMKIASERGKQTRPNLHIGICGEHGGEPESVKFCHRLKMAYVSCSPFRLLTARLAAAQAVLEESPAAATGVSAEGTR
jgi:pyruvate,orthophosphate dikinase